MTERDIANYPDAQIAPYQDPNTKAVYPEAVYTAGMFLVSSREKYIYYELDVYASVEAFEEGGNKVATVKARRITADNSALNDYGTTIEGLNYDAIIMGNSQIVDGVLQVLSGIETQFRTPTE